MVKNQDTSDGNPSFILNRKNPVHEIATLCSMKYFRCGNKYIFTSGWQQRTLMTLATYRI